MMRQLTLDIEDSKYRAFLDFIKTLYYVSIKHETIIPQWQQEEVERRLSLVESGKMKIRDWEDVKKHVFKKK
jgi:hypothetical protein